MMNYLFTDKEGVAFTKDKEVVLLTFTVTPKVAGNSSFVVRGNHTFPFHVNVPLSFAK